MKTVDLDKVKVLVRPEQADTTQGKNVIIGEKRNIGTSDKELSREVVLEKSLNENESLKVTIKCSGI